MRSFFAFFTLFALTIIASCNSKSVTERLIGKWETVGKTDSINSQIIFHTNRTVIMRNIINGDTSDEINTNFRVINNGREILFKSDTSYSGITTTILELSDTSLILENPRTSDKAKYLRSQ